MNRFIRTCMRLVFAVGVFCCCCWLTLRVQAEEEWMRLPSSTYPSSSHSYKASIDETKVFSYPGAEKLKIVFSENTTVEHNFDFLYLYDGDGKLIDKYTGTQAAGLTVVIPGDTFQIRLTSDSSVQEWGYAFSDIYKLGLGGSCGENVTWDLDASGCLTISGSGAMTDYSFVSGDRSPIYPYCERVRYVVIEEGVTSIGTCFFGGCVNLLGVKIPNSVTAIKQSAFASCSSLQSIQIPSTVTSIGISAFSNCSSLVNIILPPKITGISSMTFSRCTSLKTISIPYSVTKIYDAAFDYCSSLKTVKFGGGSYDKLRMSVGSYNYYFTDASWAYNSYTHTHSFNQTPSRVEPTCTDLGVVSTGCSCGDMNIEMLPSLGHIEVVAPAVAASCTATGLTEGRSCSRCDSTLVEQTVIPKLNHVYTNGVCSCGLIKIVASGYCGQNLTWTLDYNGLLNISGTGNMYNYDIYGNNWAPWYNLYRSVQTVVIGNDVTSIGEAAFANCYNLKDVTISNQVESLGSYAFYYCTGLTSIDIPYGVVSIGDSAFYDCESLNNVVIPNSVTSIGASAFAHCRALTNITLPDSVTSIGNSLFYNCADLESVHIGEGIYAIPGNAFASCESLINITLPDHLTSIGGGAFQGCTSLTNIDIPNTVTSIGISAFSSCKSLSTVNIPASVGNIGESAFYSCFGLTGIFVDESNPAYSSDESGVLYNKNKTVLIQAPVKGLKGSYTIPEAVTAIARYAFYGCDDLTNIAISSNITEIPYYAFYSCDNLTTIVIPDSVTKVDNYAFDFCKKLSQVIYCGTEEQWNQINIGTYNECLTSAARNYHDLQDATCVTAKTCTICGDTVGDPLGHTWQEATCTTQKTCTTCGATEGDALGHSGLWLDLIEATCTQNGLKARICGDCGITETQAIPALGHQGNPVITDPTCTTEGYTTTCCTVCGTTEIFDKVPALGHSYSSEVTPPTCTAEGYTTNTCTACGDVTVTERKPVSEHAYTCEVTPPSCTEEGYTTKTCADCGYVLVTDHKPMVDHTYTSVVTAPTCTDEGYTTKTCADCGNISVTDYIAAKGHGWSAWIQLSVPSCTAEGSQLRFCYCGVRETEILPKLPHSYTDGICSTCKQPLGGNVTLSADMNLSGLTLTEDLYIDLNGYDLSGTINTNGYKVYGMDSSTNNYTCDTMGAFSCVDENGNAIVPESLYTTDNKMRYMTIGTDSGYTFHRYYLGITNITLAPSVTGFGYKAEFYGDEMVQSQIASIGYNLWITEDRVISRTTDFKNTMTLRLKNFDVANYGDTPVNACVSITLVDGTVITGETHSNTMKQVVESVNANYDSFTESQLSAVNTLIASNPTMQSWSVENLYKKES